MEIGMGQLGWSPRALWAATLPELLAAHRGYQEREKRADHRAGTVAAALWELHRDSEKRQEPFTSNDFFPGSTEPQKEPAPTEEQIEREIASMKAAWSNE